jgi:NADPH:quinone reductase-like Zn-dependent oxidoreductase
LVVVGLLVPIRPIARRSAYSSAERRDFGLDHRVDLRHGRIGGFLHGSLGSSSARRDLFASVLSDRPDGNLRFFPESFDVLSELRALLSADRRNRYAHRSRVERIGIELCISERAYDRRNASRVERGDRNSVPLAGDDSQPPDRNRVPLHVDPKCLDKSDAQRARTNTRQLFGEMPNALLHARFPVVHSCPQRPRLLTILPGVVVWDDPNSAREADAMRAYVIRGKGLDTVLPVELPRPRPLPNQVLLRMKAASLNYRDLTVALGRYGNTPSDLIPLSDGVGEVVEVGENVTRFKPGDRVAGIFMQGWLAGRLDSAKAKTALGGAMLGVLAEFVALDENGVVAVPEHLSDEEAATLPCAAVTAWNAMFVTGSVQPGDTVLIQGTGGVSIFALQFARMAGARVVGTSSSDEKLEKLKGLGASEVTNYKTQPDWDRWAFDVTGGTGVDHVVEVGGPETLAKSLRAVRMHGEISMIGVLTGIAGEVQTANILRKHIRILGIYVGSREMFEAMNRAIAIHAFRPVIDRVFTFENALDAYRYLESGRHFGKVVIRF